jgi:hypothetical protein
MSHSSFSPIDLPEDNLDCRTQGPRTLAEYILIEDQEVWDCRGVIRKYQLHKSAPNIIFHQDLLHVMENAFDEISGYFVVSQKQSIIHLFLNTPNRLKSKLRNLCVV